MLSEILGGQLAGDFNHGVRFPCDITIKTERIENIFHAGLSLPTAHNSPTCQSGSTRFGWRKGAMMKIFYDSKMFLSKTFVFSHPPPTSFLPACVYPPDMPLSIMVVVSFLHSLFKRWSQSRLLFTLFILFSTKDKLIHVIDGITKRKYSGTQKGKRY
jgi:hypothetical protein